MSGNTNRLETNSGFLLLRRETVWFVSVSIITEINTHARVMYMLAVAGVVVA